MNRLIKSNLCFARVIVREDTSPAIFYANRGPWISLDVMLEWIDEKEEHPPIEEDLYLSGTACPSTARGEFLIRPSQPKLSFDSWTSVQVNPKYFSHFTGKPIEMILYCSSPTQPIIRWINSWKSRKIIVKSRKKHISKNDLSIGGQKKRRKLSKKHQDFEELLSYSKQCYMAISSLVVDDMLSCLKNVPRHVLVK